MLAGIHVGGAIHPTSADYRAVAIAMREAQYARQRMLDFCAANKNRMPSLMRDA